MYGKEEEKEEDFDCTLYCLLCLQLDFVVIMGVFWIRGDCFKNNREGTNT